MTRLKRLNCRVAPITHTTIDKEVKKTTFKTFGEFVDKAIEYYCLTHSIPYWQNKEQ